MSQRPQHQTNARRWKEGWLPSLPPSLPLLLYLRFCFCRALPSRSVSLNLNTGSRRLLGPGAERMTQGMGGPESAITNHVFPRALSLRGPGGRCSTTTSPESRWTGINWGPKTLNARQIYEDPVAAAQPNRPLFQYNPTSVFCLLVLRSRTGPRAL